jgi:AAA15 family ATPase/GTPase
MITRIYIDNFKTLENFEWRPEPMNLLLGENGSGKSAIFEALHRVQQFILGRGSLSELFPTKSLTVWSTVKNIQSFEIEFTEGKNTYVYVLNIDHDRLPKIQSVILEELRYNDKPLVLYTESKIKLFNNDDYSEGTTILYDLDRSALLAGARKQEGNSLQMRFIEMVSSILILKPNPFSIKDDTISTQVLPIESLQAHTTHFVSWYYQESKNQKMAIKFNTMIGEWLDGFSHLEFDSFVDDNVMLKFVFQRQFEGNKITTYQRLSDLSDGQRLRVVYYAMLAQLQVQAEKKDSANSAVQQYWFIDEPDNFIQLSEIQPLLQMMNEQVDKSNLQLSIISHHPEVYNYMIANHANEFGMYTYHVQRPNGFQSRIKPIVWKPEGISIAEQLANGWPID